MIRYCITDRKQADVLETARRVVDDRVDMLQVREKDLEGAALLELVSRVVEIATGSETRILVNDRLDVALAGRAGGVHLPSDGLPVRLVRPHIGLVGVSTHTVEEARQAAEDGADFVVFGPVFDTPGKTPIGLRPLSETCHAVQIPVLAIGGLDTGNTTEVMRRGAAGVAGIRMFLNS